LICDEHISKASNDLPILHMGGMNMAINLMVINAQNLFATRIVALSSFTGSY